MNFEEKLADALIERMTEEQKWETFKALQQFDFDEMDRMFEEYEKRLENIGQKLQEIQTELEEQLASENNT
ncbi:hypothetical protein [Actinobacillus porcinus]|uniref:Phage protein n=1 Tax=Actinobacillus porcinus TaxID=51048 RepID=A0ABY6THD4_9PAST|nr:hypothetical protein [Actinobacillus porcinus]MDD7545451.1 hypothetical protein [Actinobacillus porcinus]MDY5848066.1 hypothetical protein [Actinobacillus porcinus]VFY92334.1 Uncharacterised protein [Actinobacillus porcinus]VTU06336.1 Uncharacterised protein [Actinobacillus porcinus]